MDVKKIQNLYADEIKRLGKKEFLKVIRWKLEKYVGVACNQMDGMMILPVEDLTKDLSEKYVLKQLNTTNCFDFDYEPIDGDNLIFEIGWLFNKHGKRINRNLQYAYSSYMFKDGKWIADGYNSFFDETEIMKEGVLKNTVKAE